MTLTTDELARCFAHIERRWPDDPAFTITEVRSWTESLSKFSFDAIGRAIDDWDSDRPSRPSLSKFLSLVQSIERKKANAARHPRPFDPLDEADPVDPAVTRAGLAEARANLEKTRQAS